MCESLRADLRGSQGEEVSVTKKRYQTARHWSNGARASPLILHTREKKNKQSRVGFWRARERALTLVSALKLTLEAADADG